ncbi:MAG: hypothetical protein WBN85_11300 [Candidatus Macondimonas sp.]
MTKSRISSRMARDAEKARLARRAERQRGRLITQTRHVSSNLDPRSWFGGLLSRAGSSAGAQVSGPRFHPLLIGAVGLILPRLIRRHPVLRMAALGWSAFQLVRGAQGEDRPLPAKSGTSLFRRRG